MRIYENISHFPENERYSNIAYCNLNIGIVFEYQGDLSKAEEYYSIASDFFLKAKDSQGYIGAINNLGGIAIYRKDFKKSKELFLRAIDSSMALNDSVTLSRCFNNLGNVYYNTGDYINAKKYYDKSIDIKKKSGNIEGAAKSLINLAMICFKTGLDSDALKYGNRAWEIGDSVKNYEILLHASETLSKIFEKRGDFPKALEYYKLFKTYSDSLLNKTRVEKIEELTAVFESEKKQLQIEKMQKEAALKDETIARKSAENLKQKQLLFSVIGGLLLMAAFSIVLYRLFLQKKKANLLLSQKNAEISHQKEEIQSQRDEIEAQRDKIADINRELTSSISYASQIQAAVLPKPEFLSEVLGDYFLLYLPKSVVSGDFFWCTRAADKIIAAVADCTGHGVPGALMSMMGIAFLRDIVNHQEIHRPEEILEKLRSSIILALQQRGDTSEQKDGMDFALVSIDTNTLNCTFAGANNPMYIVGSRQQAAGSESPDGPMPIAHGQLIELKGDRMPISIHNKMGSFTRKEIQLEKGDMIYLFSDGYADQFGGENEKKFLSSRFKAMLESVAMLETKLQLAEIKQNLDKWKGSGKQTDDITILGIKV